MATSDRSDKSGSAWLTKALAYDVFLFGSFCCCLLFIAIADIRITVHEAIRFDDYGTYLEYLITDGLAGSVPTTPWRERIGGVIAYIPFTVFPAIPFHGGQGVMGDRAYLYHAIVLGNFTYLCLMSVAMFYLKQNQKLLYVLMAVLFASLVGLKGVAVVGFCFVLAIVLTHKRSFVIPALLMIIGLTVAEKVVLTVGAYFGAMLLLQARDAGLWQRIKEKTVAPTDIPWRYVMLVALSGVLILAYLYFRSRYGYTTVVDTPIVVDPFRKFNFFLTEFLSLRGMLLILPAPAMLIGISYFALDRDGFIRVMFTLAALTVASIQGELGITMGRVQLYVMPLIVYEFMKLNKFRMQASV